MKWCNSLLLGLVLASPGLADESGDLPQDEWLDASLEFLLFLGELDFRDGEWVGPLDMGSEYFSQWELAAQPGQENEPHGALQEDRE